MCFCLVLEGGAKRGIYTAGVLDVFLEKGIIADAVIGVSAGAVHGCSYISGQIGRSIRYNLKYNDDDRFMSFKSWLKTGNMVETEFAYHELPEKLDIFDHENFEKSQTKFYATCTDVETGQAVYILCQNLRGENIDYIRASASMPFVSQIVEIKGQKLLDGGIADSIPFFEAQKRGYKKIVVVGTRPKGYQKKPFLFKPLAKLFYRRYPNFIKAIENRHLFYNHTLREIENAVQQNKAFLIRPSQYVPISKMEKDPKIIQKMYDLGRQDALENLQSLKEYLKA